MDGNYLNLFPLNGQSMLRSPILSHSVVAALGIGNNVCFIILHKHNSTQWGPNNPRQLQGNLRHVQKWYRSSLKWGSYANLLELFVWSNWTVNKLMPKSQHSTTPLLTCFTWSSEIQVLTKKSSAMDLCLMSFPISFFNSLIKTQHAPKTLWEKEDANALFFNCNLKRRHDVFF